MDVALIEMPAKVAEQELKSYRRALHRRADAEYQEIALGLEELAKGTPLLQLSRVFADVPLDEKGRPRLAIARADRVRVLVECNRTGEFRFDTDYARRRGREVRDGSFNVSSPLATYPRYESLPSFRQVAGTHKGYALVPIVPPDVRGTKDLSRHFTLWEVERWADAARDVGPDVDPFLLRRVGSDLYAVVGSWDLSPIEQAILSGRRER